MEIKLRHDLRAVISGLSDAIVLESRALKI